MQRRILGGLLLALVMGPAWATFDFGPDCPLFNITTKVARRVRPGQTLMYAIRVKNAGPQTIEQLNIEAELPDYMEWPVPPKAGRAPKPSFIVWPKTVAYERVSRPLGNVVVLENVTLPARKTVTFKVRSRARNCLPQSDRLVFQAVAYLIRDLAQDCMLDARPSNVTVVKTNKASEECPAAFPILGLAGMDTAGSAVSGANMGLLPSLALAPEAAFVNDTQRQDAVRAQLRTERTAWRRSRDVGTDGAEDPVVQSFGDIQATADLNPDYEVDSIPGNAYTPPDPSHAVGLNHIVTMVNVRIAIHNKSTGAQIMAPKNINSLFSSLSSGDTCRTRNDGDPMAAWDHKNQRFVVSQFTSSSPYRQCIAVSRTADPTGAWNVYSIYLSKREMYDFPKLGVYNDAYVFTFNRFGGNYKGGAVLLLNSVPMAAGQPAQFVSWTSGLPSTTMLPAGSDNVKGLPPNGSPVPIVALIGSNSLQIQKLSYDFARKVYSLSSAVSVSVSPFTRLCPYSNCVPQKAPGPLLDSLGDRLCNRVVYNNFGTYDSMVLTHSVETGVRWYEIRNINVGGSSSTLHQEGTLGNADTGARRWLGTIAMDKAGNIGLAYAESGSDTNPSMGIAGRLATDTTSGVVTYGPTIVGKGNGALTCSCGRYGDYASMQVDPTDGCSFYAYHEYAPYADSWGTWQTRIVKFRLPNCV